MLSARPVLPNFIKTLLITLITLSSTAIFADQNDKDEVIGDLKDMTTGHALKTDEVAKEVDADAIQNSLIEEEQELTDQDEQLLEDPEEVVPAE